MKKNLGKKKDLSVLLPVMIVVLILAFIVGGLIYNSVTGGPEPMAEEYFARMMERDGKGILELYRPETLTYVSKNTGVGLPAITKRVNSRIEGWYEQKILSVCGEVLSYEIDVLETVDAEDDILQELEGIVGRSVSRAVTCKVEITVDGKDGDTKSTQSVYLMEIDDAWYLYGQGLLV